MPNKVTAFLVNEFREMLPPTLYFLAAFNLIVLTVALLSDNHELSAISHITACIGALLVGKAFLLADKLPYFHRYANQPLVYNALWKAMLYFTVTLALHLAERLISAAMSSKGLLFVADGDVATFDWSMFAIVQLWLGLLLVLYAAAGEAIAAIGRNRIHEMFFAGRRIGDLAGGDGSS